MRKLILICVCLLTFSGVFSLSARAQVTSEAERAQLESELLQLEQDIKEKEAQLAEQKAHSGGISRDISVLAAQIAAAQAKVKQKNTLITKLNKEINQKKSTINELEDTMDRNKASLASLIRKTQEFDDNASLVYLLLSNDSVSDFYGDISQYSTIKESISESVDQIKEDKSKTEVEKKNLEKKQDAEVDAKVEIENQKKKVEVSEKEKKQLLTISKQQESAYEKEVAARQARKKQILDKLFSLRDTGAIPFGKALEYATAASAKTGVRPALVLAIMTQESNLGANTGSCYLTNATTGAGINAKSKATISNVMKPSRDVSPFLSITAGVGRDPYKTLVSCPIAGGGYGGGMGPAQFIASTWIGIKTRIAGVTGGNPDPWDAHDAIFASSVLLQENLKGGSGYTAERNAACRYYSGRACDSKKPANAFYGNSVMSLAKKIQETMIDPLQDL